MPRDSHRRTLRAALPWLYAGFLLLVVSVGLSLFASIDAVRGLAENLRVPFASRWLGALGSGAFLVGIAVILPARRVVPGIHWLWVAFSLWLIELALRVWNLASTISSNSLPALRVLMAAASMLALSRGVYALWSGGERPRELRTWAATGRWFALQLFACLSLPVAALLSGDSMSKVALELMEAIPFSMALAWCLFAGPYAHLFLSLRRTARWLTRTETVSEVLAR